MTEGDTTRLVAWGHELRTVHQRLRGALRVTREALPAGAAAEPASRDLLLFCHGFCAALKGHHEGEDRTLFPEVAAARPELRDTLRALEQDHAAIAALLTGLRAAVDRSAPRQELEQHREGVAAIMENHFRYEERALAAVLDELDLDATPVDVLGPL